MENYLPKKEDWNAIKNEVIVENERVKFLAKVSVDIDIKTGGISFSLPNFGLSSKDTIIEESVWSVCKDDLIREHETWGMVELGYRAPDEYDWSFNYNRKSTQGKDGKQGKIKLVSFKTFCPYQIDLEYYKDTRNEFTIDEWIDIF